MKFPAVHGCVHYRKTAISMAHFHFYVLVYIFSSNLNKKNKEKSRVYPSLH